MPNPTTAAEWAEWCSIHEAHLSDTMCIHCAEDYARQQVAAALERAAQKIDPLTDHIVLSKLIPSMEQPMSTAMLLKEIVAAIRALKT